MNEVLIGRVTLCNDSGVGLDIWELCAWWLVIEAIATLYRVLNSLISSSIASPTPPVRTIFRGFRVRVTVRMKATADEKAGIVDGVEMTQNVFPCLHECASKHSHSQYSRDESVFRLAA